MPHYLHSTLRTVALDDNPQNHLMHVVSRLACSSRYCSISATTKHPGTTDSFVTGIPCSLLIHPPYAIVCPSNRHRTTATPRLAVCPTAHGHGLTFATPSPPSVASHRRPSWTPPLSCFRLQPRRVCSPRSAPSRYKEKKAAMVLCPPKNPFLRTKTLRDNYKLLDQPYLLFPTMDNMASLSLNIDQLPSEASTPNRPT